MERKPISLIVAIALTAILIFGSVAVNANQHDEEEEEDEEGELEEVDDDEFTSDFMMKDCRFKTRGNNPLFPLQPGYQLTLEGEEDETELRVQITVLRETERIFTKGIGRPSIRTRVVEEREWEDGELVEVSRNFFAVCRQTGDVFYFGEDVDDYEDGKIVGHDGAWKAGENGAKPGIIMPGRFLLGSSYMQEIAPGVALDTAEHEEMGLDMDTEAGSFSDCVFVKEGTLLDPDEESEKIYCPGIGLVYDDGVELVDYGYVRKR